MSQSTLNKDSHTSLIKSEDDQSRLLSSEEPFATMNAILRFDRLCKQCQCIIETDGDPLLDRCKECCKFPMATSTLLQRVVSNPNRSLHLHDPPMGTLSESPIEEEEIEESSLSHSVPVLSSIGSSLFIPIQPKSNDDS